MMKLPKSANILSTTNHFLQFCAATAVRRDYILAPLSERGCPQPQHVGASYGAEGFPSPIGWERGQRRGQQESGERAGVRAGLPLPLLIFLGILGLFLAAP